MAEASTPEKQVSEGLPVIPEKPAPKRSVTLKYVIKDSIDTAISENPQSAHILATISRQPVLWNEQYKPYFKYSYIIDTPHEIPILTTPLDPKLQEDLDFLEQNLYMKVRTHMVSLDVRNRRALGTGEVVRVVEVDMVPKFRGYHAANEQKAKSAGKEENKSHGVGSWLKCKGRKENGVCDCVLDVRTVWDDKRVIAIN